MNSPMGEWGRRLETPDLSGVAHLFIDASGNLASPSVQANILPPSGYAFVHRLASEDELLVSRITVNHDTLHPLPEHHRVRVGNLAGKVVLGGRIRFFPHAVPEPIMDLIDKDGSDPQAQIRFLVGSAATFDAISFHEMPVNKHHGRVIPPRRLYSAAMTKLELPPLPPDVVIRLDQQYLALQRIIGESPEPRSRSRE